jgi:hypothetical protein
MEQPEPDPILRLKEEPVVQPLGRRHMAWVIDSKEQVLMLYPFSPAPGAQTGMILKKLPV